MYLLASVLSFIYDRSMYGARCRECRSTPIIDSLDVSRVPLDVLFPHTTPHTSRCCVCTLLYPPPADTARQRTHTKRVFVCICKSCLQNLSGSLSSVGSMCLWCSWLSHAGMPLGRSHCVGLFPWSGCANYVFM